MLDHILLKGSNRDVMLLSLLLLRHARSNEVRQEKKFCRTSTHLNIALGQEMQHVAEEQRFVALDIALSTDRFILEPREYGTPVVAVQGTEED